MHTTILKSCILIGIILITVSAVKAQDDDGPMGNSRSEGQTSRYRGDEFVSMNDGVPFNTALQILNQFSKRFDGKIIVDPQRRTIPIGVVIDNMYWKKALEYILNANDLQYRTLDQYYEIYGEEKPMTTVIDDNTITPRTQEVRIEAVFFEADRTKLTEIGVDWSTFNNGSITIDVGGAAEGMEETSLSGAYHWNNGVWDIYSLMKLFETNSIGEVISKPQIKVMDGQLGKVKVGRNFYLTTRDFSGNTRYREYEAGTILTVTPNIISKDDTTFIHLDVIAERSNVIPDATGVSKAITESRTQTLLLNGEQTIIAGLYSNDKSTTRKGVPLFKDLPGWLFGLRYLFGYNSIQDHKKELVILIKAEIVPEIAKRKVNAMRQKRYQDSLENKFK